MVDNNADNRMFTRGVNVGILDALQRGAQYIWLLNNDAIPGPDYLVHSLRRFTLSPRCAIVGGKNLRMDDPDRIFWGGSGRSFPSGRCKMGLVSRGDLNKPTVEPWGPFSSVVIDARLFSMIGLLDEQFRMISSDSDYCFRARLAGYQFWYEPAAVLRHQIGASGSAREKQPAAMLKVLQTDQQRFYDKWSEITGCMDRDSLDKAINAWIANPSRLG